MILSIQCNRRDCEGSKNGLSFKGYEIRLKITYNGCLGSKYDISDFTINGTTRGLSDDGDSPITYLDENFQNSKGETE